MNEWRGRRAASHTHRVRTLPRPRASAVPSRRHAAGHSCRSRHASARGSVASTSTRPAVCRSSHDATANTPAAASAGRCPAPRLLVPMRRTESIPGACVLRLVARDPQHERGRPAGAERLAQHSRHARSAWHASAELGAAPRFGDAIAKQRQARTACGLLPCRCTLDQLIVQLAPEPQHRFLPTHAPQRPRAGQIGALRRGVGAAGHDGARGELLAHAVARRHVSARACPPRSCRRVVKFNMHMHMHHLPS
eukprot:scaffold32933_cov86-Phaeocystis_antarctica.AAC.1